MRAFVQRAAKYVLYPLFYLFCLVVCFYLTFPWDALKQKLITDFAKNQSSKGEKAWRLEIGSVSGYWFTGVEMQDVRIIMPASDEDEDAKKTSAGGAGFKLETDNLPADTAPGAGDAKTAKDAKPKGPTESVVTIPNAHARVEMLPLLIGRVRIDFEAEAFGGNVHGTIPTGGGTLNIEVENVDLGQVAPLRDLVSLPLKGIANGKIEIVADNGKWTKSTGSLDMKIADVVLGDGKAKLMGKATLPPAQLGDFEMSGKITEGMLKLDKFGATGKDVDVIGEGTLKVKEPWDMSQLDLYIRFNFADSYKIKDDKTLALFGDPKDPTSIPALDFIPKLKKAKRPDGFYGFRGHGPLKKLRWDPTKDDGPAKAPAGAGSAMPDDDAPPTPPPPGNGRRTTPKQPRKANPSDGDTPPAIPTFRNPPPRGEEPDQNPQAVPDSPGPDREGPQIPMTPPGQPPQDQPPPQDDPTPPPQ